MKKKSPHKLKLSGHYSSEFKKTFVFLLSKSYGFLNSKQFELIRVTFARAYKTVTRISLKNKYFFLTTKKKKHSRMGKGKGLLDSFRLYKIFPGRCLLELGYIFDVFDLYFFFRKAVRRLPVCAGLYLSCSILPL